MANVFPNPAISCKNIPKNESKLFWYTLVGVWQDSYGFESISQENSVNCGISDQIGSNIFRYWKCK